MFNATVVRQRLVICLKIITLEKKLEINLATS